MDPNGGKIVAKGFRETKKGRRDQSQPIVINSGSVSRVNNQCIELLEGIAFPADRCVEGNRRDAGKI